MNQLRVFVTGASGLVGLHLVQFLAQRNYQVIACLRPTSKQEALLKISKANAGVVRIVAADLSEEKKLAGLMLGCDVIVHTAASIAPHGKKEVLKQVNVLGTRSALNAAIIAGVSHFIHISSLSVITGQSDCFDITEEEPLQYCHEAYTNSKIDAEKIVMKESRNNRIAVTSLRPGFIYGPTERTWLPRLIQALKSGRAMLVGDSRKQTNVIYVENLVRAIQLAILNPTVYGQVYNLTDGQVVTKRQLFDTISAELNLPYVKLTIPVFLARLLVTTASSIAPVSSGRLKDFLSQYSWGAFRLVAVNQGFDISKAERELNYIDRIPFAEGMARTLAAWK